MTLSASSTDRTRSSSAGSPIGGQTPLPVNPCSYFSLTTAEQITRSKLTGTIDRIEQAVGYSVCEYNGSRRNVNVDIGTLPVGSPSAVITKVLMRPFYGFPRTPSAVHGLGQEAYMDVDADRDNGYVNLVYMFAQDGVVVETIAVVGTAESTLSEGSLRTAEFAMASHL